MANSTAASLLNNYGTDGQKARFLRPILTGTQVGCIGLTEPNAGSDAANIQTRAVLKDGCWVISGAKTFISNSGSEITGPIVIAAVTGNPARRPQGDFQLHRAERHARLQPWQEAAQDRLARIDHIRAVLRGLRHSSPTTCSASSGPASDRPCHR
ncbi:acyl-CoA dehydrogenase family protein [Cupriavidus basilensis]